MIIRSNYSNSPVPTNGAAIVTTILSDELLKKEWNEESTTIMRQRIQYMRQLFVNTLQEKDVKKDLSFISKQNGIFTFSGLNEE